jgi:hypothetical protein
MPPETGRDVPAVEDIRKPVVLRSVLSSRRVIARIPSSQFFPHSHTSVMYAGMALATEHDQIFGSVGSPVGAETEMVHIKLRTRAAPLAAPAVAAQDRQPQGRIGICGLALTPSGAHFAGREGDVRRRRRRARGRCDARRIRSPRRSSPGSSRGSGPSRGAWPRSPTPLR